MFSHLIEQAAEWFLKRATKKDAWSASGKLITRNREQAVMLQAEFKLEPDYYTLQFGVDYPAAGGSPLAVAEIFWTVEGNQIRRFIEVADGVAISGTGQGVNVKVTDFSVAPTTAGVQYPVTVQLTKGVRPNVEKPPIVRDFNRVFPATIAPAASSFSSPPADAGATSAFIMVTATDNASAPIANDEILVTFESSSGTVVAQAGFEVCNCWVPLIGGTPGIRVTNNRAAGNIFFSIVYGVEG